MPAEKFETQPYYDVTDTTVSDKRIAEIPEDCHGSLQRFGTAAVNQYTPLEYAGNDGEDYSGFIALHGIDTPEGASLAVIRSLQFDHSTGIPSRRDSWSAEFDDIETAKDFWQGWRPRFDGIKFVKSAREYLAAHAEIPRDTIRVQELGMLLAWYDQKGGDAVILDKFSTDGRDVVRTPSKYSRSEALQAGQIYKVSRQRYVYGPPFDAKTCMAAFVIPGGRRPWGAAPAQDITVAQWSDGTISRHSDRELLGGSGPAALTAADLD